MSSRIHSPATRAAAIADYYASGDKVTVVAERHGVSRAALSRWVSTYEPDIAYVGGWETIGGIKRPLFPERRSA